MTIPEDDLTIEIQLRPIEEAAHRMVILAGMIQIALTLLDPDDDRPVEHVESELSDLADALLIGESTPYLTEQERRFLESEWALLDEESLGEMLWRVEALEVLDWATSAPSSEIKSPWLPTEFGRLIAAIAAPWEETGSFVSTRSYVPEIQIATLREVSELWVWRGAVDEELRTATGSERDELLAAIADTAREAEEAHLLDSVNGDFLVEHDPYHRAPDETKAVIAQVSFQRLWALNWLCGFGASWDDVPLDV